MSLVVKHLNADTTFLLTFRPAFAPAHAPANFPGSFNILIDPWLSGHSSVWTPSFQISHHTSAPCVQSLRDIPEPDLIIISQDKPDHCHRETLCTLPADTRVPILATAAAAKKIRSWKHFTHAPISTFTPYKPERSQTLVRIPVPSYSSRSSAGEVTIAYMPQKMDATALHNAIGITYRAPGTTTVTPYGSIKDLPLTPTSTPPDSRARTPASPVRNTLSPVQDSYATPPDSPMEGMSYGFPLVMKKEKVLSVLYSPHGVSLSAVMPYANTHLVKEDALPLTTLFHSLNVEENPWFMGGRVAAGYPGGEAMVRALGARTWISAHDEAKDNRGWSVTWIKSIPHTIEEVQKKLNDDLEGIETCVDNKAKKVHTKTTVVNLDSGESLQVS